MKSNILQQTEVLTILYLKQGTGEVYVMVDFIWIGLLELQDAEARITKWKNIAHSETRTHDPLIVKPPPLPLGHQTWYTIDKFL